MSKSKRVYLEAGTIIGCEGYTDLKITKTKNGHGFKLASTEGGTLDFYDEVADTHYDVSFDMKGSPDTNKNFGKLYYIKD